MTAGQVTPLLLGTLSLLAHAVNVLCCMLHSLHQRRLAVLPVWVFDYDNSTLIWHKKVVEKCSTKKSSIVHCMPQTPMQVQLSLWASLAGTKLPSQVSYSYCRCCRVHPAQV